MIGVGGHFSYSNRRGVFEYVLQFGTFLLFVMSYDGRMGTWGRSSIIFLSLFNGSLIGEEVDFEVGAVIECRVRSMVHYL